MSASTLPLERLDRVENYGHSIQTIGYVYRPTEIAQIEEVFDLARRTGHSVALRGAGRSYGDAATNSGQIVLDLQRMNRILAWDPRTGVIKVEPGVTIEQLWKHVLEDGYWPPVTSGTMFPTLAGALAHNIHGKNNTKAGTLGEHVLAFTALLPNGQHVTCTPTENSELFYALISTAGLLGVFTSITLRLKKVQTGLVDVHAWAMTHLRDMLRDLDTYKNDFDYIVGWVDTLDPNGRGQIHGAHYVHDAPNGAATLKLANQVLPDTFFGLVPKSMLWLFMTPFMNNLGTRLINTAKYVYSATLEQRKVYRQSLVEFNYLLDYVPNWEKSYGRAGLIQYQTFIPLDTACDAYLEMLRLAQRRGMPPFLGVTKRHRPDKFLFTHAVDGYSFAMDFKVTSASRLQRLCEEMSDIALDAGGRFYFAKDSTLTADRARRYLGEATLARFKALKTQCDPENLLQTDLYRRLLVG